MPARIADLSAQKERLSSELAQMRLRLFKLHIQNMEKKSSFVWLIWEDAKQKDLPVMASALAEMTGDGMVLLPLDCEGYYAAIASTSGKAKEIAAHISAACGGKGGGSQILWQGKLERLPTESQLGVRS
ncbi:MAG: DHH family phosphoesterase [Clostridiales bacterium]|nr:DHH family phosphoesterase [Clostridiales bacterium]